MTFQGLDTHQEEGEVFYMKENLRFMNGLEQLLAVQRHSGTDGVRLRQLVFLFRPSSAGELEKRRDILTYTLDWDANVLNP